MRIKYFGANDECKDRVALIQFTENEWDCYEYIANYEKTYGDTFRDFGCVEDYDFDERKNLRIYEAYIPVENFEDFNDLKTNYKEAKKEFNALKKGKKQEAEEAKSETVTEPETAEPETAKAEPETATKTLTREGNMTKTDKKILEHLKPYSALSDTYFCSIYFKNKDRFMYSVFDKVKAWTEKNGGRIEKLSDKKTIGERKGFIVRIIFPCHGKRDMKNIMSLLYTESVTAADYLPEIEPETVTESTETETEQTAETETATEEQTTAEETADQGETAEKKMDDVLFETLIRNAKKFPPCDFPEATKLLNICQQMNKTQLSDFCKILIEKGIFKYECGQIVTTKGRLLICPAPGVSGGD